MKPLDYQNRQTSDDLQRTPLPRWGVSGSQSVILGCHKPNQVVTPIQGALLDVSPDWGKLIPLAPRIQLWSWYLHFSMGINWGYEKAVACLRAINSRYSTLHWSTTVKIPGWQNLESTKMQVLCLYSIWWHTSSMNIQGLPLQKLLITQWSVSDENVSFKMRIHKSLVPEVASTVETEVVGW